MAVIVSEERCRRYRRRILEISQQVTAAHVAPAFSCLEIVDALYNEVMRPQDVFIMSKGHGCLAQYVVLEDRGVLPRSALDAYCQHSAEPSPMDGPPRLAAHPDYAPGWGIHASTGSLGHGLGIGAGQALAEKLKGSDVRVYVLLSDGECQEGSTWEAAMVAANLKLDNLTALVDYNDFGGMDKMSEHHQAFAPLSNKFTAFCWWTSSCNGHSSANIQFELQITQRSANLPRALVCRTVKGKGISFMENVPVWHYKSPSSEEYALAMKELE